MASTSGVSQNFGSQIELKRVNLPESNPGRLPKSRWAVVEATNEAFETAGKLCIYDLAHGSRSQRHSPPLHTLDLAIIDAVEWRDTEVQLIESHAILIEFSVPWEHLAAWKGIIPPRVPFATSQPFSQDSQLLQALIPLSCPKHALICGNWDYLKSSALSKLATPEGDRNLMINTLRRLGFLIDFLEETKNMTGFELKKVIDDWVESLPCGALTVFFFDGHGDQDRKTEEIMLYGTDGISVFAQDTCKKINSKNPIFNLIILECCRNSGKEAGKCSVNFEPTKNSAVITSCASGQIASDELKNKNCGKFVSIFCRYFSMWFYKDLFQIIELVSHELKKDGRWQDPSLTATCHAKVILESPPICLANSTLKCTITTPDRNSFTFNLTPLSSDGKCISVPHSSISIRSKTDWAIIQKKSCGRLKWECVPTKGGPKEDVVEFRLCGGTMIGSFHLKVADLLGSVAAVDVSMQTEKSEISSQLSLTSKDHREHEERIEEPLPFSSPAPPIGMDEFPTPRGQSVQHPGNHRDPTATPQMETTQLVTQTESSRDHEEAQLWASVEHGYGESFLENTQEEIVPSFSSHPDAEDDQNPGSQSPQNTCGHEMDHGESSDLTQVVELDDGEQCVGAEVSLVFPPQSNQDPSHSFPQDESPMNQEESSPQISSTHLTLHERERVESTTPCLAVQPTHDENANQTSCQLNQTTSTIPTSLQQIAVTDSRKKRDRSPEKIPQNKRLLAIGSQSLDVLTIVEKSKELLKRLRENPARKRKKSLENHHPLSQSELEDIISGSIDFPDSDRHTKACQELLTRFSRDDSCNFISLGDFFSCKLEFAVYTTEKTKKCTEELLVFFLEPGQEVCVDNKIYWVEHVAEREEESARRPKRGSKPKVSTQALSEYVNLFVQIVVRCVRDSETKARFAWFMKQAETLSLGNNQTATRTELFENIVKEDPKCLLARIGLALEPQIGDGDDHGQLVACTRPELLREARRLMEKEGAKLDTRAGAFELMVAALEQNQGNLDKNGKEVLRYVMSMRPS